MARKLRRYRWLGLFGAVCSVLLWFSTPQPVQAHWADLATAEVVVEGTEARLTLTYPTGLTAFADDDSSGRISAEELNRHRAALLNFFKDHIQLRDLQPQPPTLTLGSAAGINSLNRRIAPNTHTTLQLLYAWAESPTNLAMTYTLFVPDAPKASCLVTVSQAGEFASHVFTPEKTTQALVAEPTTAAWGGWLLPLLGAFVWGAVHSLSPGHGKTLVGAYLVGERATSRHALFLALTTTITHTVGVFVLGFVTLAATRYVLPEQLFPWLSLLSGGLVIGIGMQLIRQRTRYRRQMSGQGHSHPHHEHDHSDHAHAHSHGHHSHSHHHHDDDHSDHAHTHGHNNHGHGHHHHNHSHPRPTPHASHPDPAHNPIAMMEHTPPHHSTTSHTHTHLPLAADGQPVTWRGLLLLGFSAGLVPCPAALVLLLGAIGLGNPVSGLVLVLAFSLGLASVLTGLGLLLVSAKRAFQQLPAPRLRQLRWLPLASAVGITLIGVGISTQAVLQIL